MNVLSAVSRQFDHPIPGIVIFVGIGLWILATAVSIAGFLISRYDSLSFTLVALFAAMIGALGTIVIMIGGAWYGILVLLDLRAARRRARNSN